jgi:hypothetical protein
MRYANVIVRDGFGRKPVKLQPRHRAKATQPA